MNFNITYFVDRLQILNFYLLASLIIFISMESKQHPGGKTDIKKIDIKTSVLIHDSEHTWEYVGDMIR